MNITFVRFFLISASAFLFFGSYDSFLSNNYIGGFAYLGFGFLFLGETSNLNFFLKKINLREFFSIRKDYINFQFSDFMNIIGYFFLTLAVIFFIVDKFN